MIVPTWAPEHRPSSRKIPAGATCRVPVGVLLLIFIIGGCGTTSITKMEVRERKDSVIVRYDTVRFYTQSDSIRIDTVWLEGKPVFRSVKARLDTTVGGTSVSLGYDFPPDAWQVRIAKQDTVIRWVARDSIVQRPYRIEIVPIWMYIALVGMSFALLIAAAALLITRKSN